MAHVKPTADTVFAGELAQAGSWVVACLHPQLAWPTSVQKLTYRSQTVFVLPQFDDYYPSMAVRLGDEVEAYEDGQVLILNLLSALCWVEGRGALVEHWTGGSRPHPMAGFANSGGGMGMVRTDHFQFHYLPEISERRTRWALAFYREGLSIRPVAYAFLSFYKILNILNDRGPAQKKWINSHVNIAAKHLATERLGTLLAARTDMGKYLYESGRCAVAHAGHGRTVDPENPTDLKRLTEDLPLIKDLAAYAIEFELGVKSSATVYREHLYELEGFNQIVGDGLRHRLKERQTVKPEEVPAFPKLNVGLLGEDDYAPLSNLTTNVASVKDGIIALWCVSDDGQTRIALGLDFPNEQLLVDTIQGLISLDDGSAASARDAVTVMAFKKAHFANGQLVVERADNGERMGRRNAFIPENVDMGATLSSLDGIIDQLSQVADERDAKETAG